MHIVWPLETETLHLYGAGLGWMLRPGVMVDSAESSVAAAKAVKGEHDAAAVMRFAVLGPEGLAVVNLAPIEGQETLSLEPGPHR